MVKVLFVVALVIGFVFLVDSFDRWHRESKAQKKDNEFRINMDLLGGVIYNEIRKYCEEHNYSLDLISSIHVGTSFTWVYYCKGRIRYKQEINYEQLGYKVDTLDEDLVGQKEYWIKVALVKRLGEDKWGVKSSRSHESYEVESEVVISDKPDGTIVATHPTRHYEAVRSEIVPRKELDEYHRKQTELSSTRKHLTRL